MRGRATAQERRVARALVIEDDPAIREAVTGSLREAGHEVRCIEDAVACREAVESFRPDVVLLDIHLPGGTDGFGAARSIRAMSEVPFLFMTSSTHIDDVLAGFEIGAEDYIRKPFAVAELVVRVETVLRRTGALDERKWRVGELVIDEAAHSVVVAGSPVALTALEFDVLVALARRPGRVISKVQLLNEVWGFADYSLNVVEVHVSSLRKKLETESQRMIHTVRNVGYVLRA